MTLRKARLDDIGRLLELINGYAVEGIMLPRTEFEISEHIRDFTVLHSDLGVLGCGALHIYSPAAAEVRSLAVEPQSKGSGAGRALVAALEREARDFELHTLFAFTYVPDFFRRLGFSEVDRAELPLKAWKDCLRCPKFQACDEIAMVKRLRPPVVGVPHTRIRGQSSLSLLREPELVPLPLIKR